MESVLRIGLIENYSEHIELTNTPHGHIDLANSIKKGTLNNSKLFCDYELYDTNSYQNRIIRSTILSMISSPDLDRNIRYNLKVIDRRLGTISPIKLDTISWNRVDYKGRNKEYRMTLRLCKLYLDALLPSNGEGGIVRGFINNSQEHQLFEEFVRGYFEIEHPKLFKSQRQLKWAVTGEHSEYLPGMEMDILLRRDNNVLIIDTKCYNTILSGKNGSKGLNSPNLYQINTYVQNWSYQNKDDHVSGMLLYAKTDEDFNSCNNHLLGHMIYTRALDCNQDWYSIKSCLDDIAKLIQ